MRLRWALLLRGFLLEAHFNPRGKQRGGLGWILGDRFPIDPAAPFNANPVVAGYATGWIRGSGLDADLRHLAPLASALGAVGDRIVWGALRGTASAAAIAVSFLGPIPAALAYLLVYNPPELALRWRGVRVGLAGIEAIMADLSRAGLPRVLPIAGRIFACAAGIAAGSLFAGGIAGGPAGGGGWGTWIAAAAAICFGVSTRRKDLGFRWSAVAALALGLAWLALGRISDGR